MTLNTKTIQLYDGVELMVLEDYIGGLVEKSLSYYEKEILSYLLDYLPADSIIYDVGANIGNHTVYFSKYLKAKKIYSFEPVKATYDVLTSNVKNNLLEDRVTTYNYAIGEADGFGQININEENMGNSKVIESQQGEIQIKALDNLQLESPDFVKIDVEGFELNVLNGMQSIIKESKPILWIEIFSDSFGKVDSILTENGYVLVDRWLDNYVYLPLAKYSTDQIFNLIKNKAFKRYNAEINRLTLLARDKNNLISKLQEMQKSKSNVSSEGIPNFLLDRIEQLIQRENETFNKLNELVEQQILQMQQVQFAGFNNNENTDDILTKLELIAREEELIQNIEERALELRRIEEDNTKLKLELNTCSREKEILERKYNALKNSKAGKFMLKYWALRNKRK